MKKQIFILTALVFIWITGTCFAGDAPQQVAVFKLNSNIADVKDYVIMETALPIRYLENIEEVEIKPIEGLKSGLIAYATCSAPGHIVRIKLKYKDSSKKFYEDLLKRIKNKYGNPSEYRGDPFHIHQLEMVPGRQGRQPNQHDCAAQLHGHRGKNGQCHQTDHDQFDRRRSALL